MYTASGTYLTVEYTLDTRFGIPGLYISASPDSSTGRSLPGGQHRDDAARGTGWELEI